MLVLGAHVCFLFSVVVVSVCLYHCFFQLGLFLFNIKIATQLSKKKLQLFRNQLLGTLGIKRSAIGHAFGENVDDIERKAYQLEMGGGAWGSFGIHGNQEKKPRPMEWWTKKPNPCFSAFHNATTPASPQ
jgi:hypothetical protein